MASALHWEICKQNELHHELKWYEHEPDSVMENDKCKILWDFTIHTDHIIQTRRADIVLVNKQERICQLIDVACPADRKVVEKVVAKLT